MPELEGTYHVQETGARLKDSDPGEESQKQQPHAHRQEAEGQREHPPAAHQRPILPVAPQQEPRRHARPRPGRLHERGEWIPQTQERLFAVPLCEGVRKCMCV